MGRILFDDDLHDLIPLPAGTLGVDLSVVKASMRSFLLQDQTLALIAHYAINGMWGRNDWPEEWNVASLIAAASASRAAAGFAFLR